MVEYRKTSHKPLPEEREVTINIIQDESGEWVAILDTNISKYDNRCRKQGWTLRSVTEHTDGSWVSSEWIAPASALTIRQAERKKRTMTEEQRQAAAERLKKARERKEENG